MTGRWEQVISQPWYQDGVTDADFVRITLITAENEEDFQRMLQGDYLESETYSLPLAGKVTAYVISKVPYQQEALFEALGAGMKAIEDIIGAPWPDPYPVVRVISESYAPSGYSLLTGDIELHVSDLTTGTVYHELAHHYFHLFPAWMNEGAADFLETYSLHLTGDASLQSAYDSVAGGCSASMPNVHKWLKVRAGRQNYRQLCDYIVGQRFWLGMYLSLGHDVVSSQLRGLYRAIPASAKGSLVLPEQLWPEETIYQVLLLNTPPEKQDEFRDLYRQLHGGPIPDSDK